MIGQKINENSPFPFWTMYILDIKQNDKIKNFSERLNK